MPSRFSFAAYSEVFFGLSYPSLLPQLSLGSAATGCSTILRAMPRAAAQAATSRNSSSGASAI